jgi:hypothetical protein
MPARIIFAYEGPDLETTRSHLTEQDRGIQPEHMVDLIVVNNKYHMSKVGYGGYQEAGQPFQPWGTMQFFRMTRFIGGISLMHMILRIQILSTYGSLIAPNFDEYYKQMKISRIAGLCCLLSLLVL